MVMPSDKRWVGTWAAAPAPAEGVVGFNNQTIRLNPRLSIGGQQKPCQQQGGGHNPDQQRQNPGQGGQHGGGQHQGGERQGDQKRWTICIELEMQGRPQSALFPWRGA
jgi:hypothetical protein